MNAKSNRLLLAYIIDPIKSGDTFERSKWPLHITLVPWFRVPSFDVLETNLNNLSRRLTGFNVLVGGREMFGRARDILVNLIVPNEQILKLHNELYQFIESNEGVLEYKLYSGQAYRPHVTRYSGRGCGPGQDLMVDRIHLVELITESKCKVVGSYELKKAA